MQMGLKAFSSSCPHPPLLREPWDLAPMDPPTHTKGFNLLSWSQLSPRLWGWSCCPTICALPKDRGPCAGMAWGCNVPNPSCHPRTRHQPHYPPSCPPQTHFPITPSCTRTSQPTMWQGIKMLVLGPHHRKPHRAGARFQAQAVPLHSGLRSQKG